MGRFFGAAAVLALIAAAAAPAGAQEAATCRALTDDAKRLACYDALEPAAIAPVGPPAAAASRWEIAESRSPIDDTAQITASLVSQTDEKNPALLIVRCRERREEVVIGASEFWGLWSADQSVPVLYRIQGQPAVSMSWIPGFGHRLDASSAFFPRPARTFLEALPDHGSVFFRVSDYQGVPHDMTFALEGIAAVRQKVGEACGWAHKPR